MGFATLKSDFTIPRHMVRYPVTLDDGGVIEMVAWVPALTVPKDTKVEVGQRGVADSGIHGVTPGESVSVCVWVTREQTADTIGLAEVLAIPSRLLELLP